MEWVAIFPTNASLRNADLLRATTNLGCLSFPLSASLLTLWRSWVLRHIPKNTVRVTRWRTQRAVQYTIIWIEPSKRRRENLEQRARFTTRGGYREIFGFSPGWQASLPVWSSRVHGYNSLRHFHFLFIRKTSPYHPFKRTTR